VENIFANYFFFFFQSAYFAFLQSAKSFFVFCVLLNSLTLQPLKMFPLFCDLTPIFSAFQVRTIFHKQVAFALAYSLQILPAE
jgi:hypothetical protein